MEAAGSYISDAVGWLGEANNDLAIIGQMQGGTYDETDHRLLSVTTGTGGTATLSTSNPAAGSEVTVTLRPNTGYMVGNIEIVDADGYAVGYIYDDATNTVLFTMPTLSGDP